MGGQRPKQQKAVDNTKFYEILGIEKTASEEEVRKGFKRAALIHHPDRGGDPEKFKEVNRAYEILGDKEKREAYDEGGEEGLEGGGGMHDDIFDMFGGGGGGGRRKQSQKQKGEDVLFPMAVSLDELYTGCSKKLRLTRNVICQGCKGKGGKNVVTCTSCRGQGVKMVIRQLGPGMITQMQQTCGACKGQGQTISEKDKCKTCDGQKIAKESKNIDVFVAKGSKHGLKQIFRGEADELPDTIAGDVVVVLQQKEHPVFKRQSHHLFMKKSITLTQALCGFEFTITHLDKRTLHVKCEGGSDVVTPGDFKCIADEGMPHHDNPNLTGNLYIEFTVEFPTKDQLNDKTRQALLQLLPCAPKIIVPDDAEETSLVAVDMSLEKKKIQEELEEQAEMEEEERRQSGGGGGGGQPQCRQA